MSLAPTLRVPPRRAVIVGGLIALVLMAALAIVARKWHSLADRWGLLPSEPLEEAIAAPHINTLDDWRREVAETNSIGMKLVVVPAGEFRMGAPESPRDLLAWAHEMSPGTKYQLAWFAGETPQHVVRISEPLAIGMYEVTRGQFAQFVAATSYRTDAEKDGLGGTGWTGKDTTELPQRPQFTWRFTGFEQTDDHPVVNVSWNDALAFCDWLTRKEGLRYRLPTEAEWEYACRAGTTTRYSFGDEPEGLVRAGNVRDQAVHEVFKKWENCLPMSDGFAFTSPVGQFPPNAFGLCDMHGNVAEWCLDWYSEQYFAVTAPIDPQGPSVGSFRVVRGGGWSRRAVGCRSTSRRNGAPHDRNAHDGFRVVCVP